MTVFTRYIRNEQHYDEVLSCIADVRRTLWIGTADIKDVYVKHGVSSVPLLKILAGLIKRGVDIRLIHAKEPGPAFRKDFDKYPVLASRLERVLCPRVHFKLIVFDLETAYIGSANLTGAGIGMKSPSRRNFEAGIFTNEPALVNGASGHFDAVWMGSFCDKCGRKMFCGDQIR
jgi:phosphatidylserine/phosphatidylglycerophosphate/cardiolipin synthase-like enzyme